MSKRDQASLRRSYGRWQHEQRWNPDPAARVAAGSWAQLQGID